MFAQTEPYYRAALAALRCLEQRAPTKRRFCAEADALWRGFKGDLETADRIDLMISDADAQWPGAFGARTVFGFEATAEDEAFGVQWTGLDTVRAEEVWREVLREEPPASSKAAFEACARVWGEELRSYDPGSIDAADQLLLCGPSAIVGTALAFEAGTSLDWAAQVAVIATEPKTRQLACLANALLNSTKPFPLYTAAQTADARLTGRRLVLSEDASSPDTAAARQCIEPTTGA